jgi:hypothetical protein
LLTKTFLHVPPLQRLLGGRRGRFVEGFSPQGLLDLADQVVVATVVVLSGVGSTGA